MIKFFRNKEYIDGKLVGIYTYYSFNGWKARRPPAIDDMPKYYDSGVAITYNISSCQRCISFWEYIKSKITKGD